MHFQRTEMKRCFGLFTAIVAMSAILAACNEAATQVSEGAVSPLAVAPLAAGDLSAADQLHAEQRVAGGAVDGSRLAKALSICLDNVPDMGRARQEMLVAGFRPEGSVRGQDLYSAADRSVFALISVGTHRPRCAIGRDGLHGEPAIAFAEQALQQAYGPAFVPVPTDGFSEPVIAAWLTERPTGVLGIAVSPALDIPPFFRGSFVVVTTDVELSNQP